MGLNLLITLTVASIILPPAVVWFLAKRVEGSDADHRQKIYSLTKVMLAGIFICFILYLPAMTSHTYMDGCMNLVDGLPLPIVFKALLFALILVSPFLLSVGIMLFIVSVYTGRIKGKEAEMKKMLLGILTFIGGIILPIFIFGSVWIALIVYLPHSLTSKWWFNLIMYGILIYLAFAITAEVSVRRKRGTLPEDLRAELDELCRRAGVKVKDIVLKNSPDVVNAYATGFLPGHRYIVLTQGLLEKMDRDEIKAVVAHELGHIKLHHLWINLGLAVGWFIFFMAVVQALKRLGIPIFSNPMVNIITLLVALLTWNYIFSGFVAVRNEFKADEFAAKLVGADAMARALEKLYQYGNYPKKTAWWFKLLSYHPCIEERIRHVKMLRGVGSA